MSIQVKMLQEVTATLIVRDELGKEWEADDADLARFGLLVSHRAEYAVALAMEAMGLDPERAHAALRYAIARAVRGDPLGRAADDAEVVAELAAWVPLVPACDPEDRPAADPAAEVSA